jgi:hypothetical protein
VRTLGKLGVLGRGRAAGGGCVAAAAGAPMTGMPAAAPGAGVPTATPTATRDCAEGDKRERGESVSVTICCLLPFRCRSLPAGSRTGTPSEASTTGALAGGVVPGRRVVAGGEATGAAARVLLSVWGGVTLHWEKKDNHERRSASTR